MTIADFRRIALSMPEAVEGAHMGHPDFRVRNKIFATLFPRKGEVRGMVKLTPQQQRRFVKEYPGIFEPVAGGWGVKGATRVHLNGADKVTLRKAIFTAWCNTAPQNLVEQLEPSQPKPVAARSGMGTKYVALLRGINVGGKNKLSMRDLAAIFDEAGCAQVRTYIQSGNVVFSAGPACAKRLPQLISQRIAEQFGLRVPVVVRTAGEFGQVAAGNPFLESGVDPGSLHVVFLADPPGRRLIAALDPKRSPGDSFEIRGREIYLHLPNGVARTKLTNDYFEAKLATTSTMRNWRTVMKLREMTGAIA